MKKEPTSSTWIIILMIFSGLLLGILISDIYNNTNNKIIISQKIFVRDFTDIKEITNYLNPEYVNTKYLLSDAVEKVVNNEFDRTINYLNFAIVLFALFLTVIIAVFGFFTFNKMKEAKFLLDEISGTPDAVMKKYYDNQLNNLIPKLISSSPLIKSDSISKINSNSELNPEKHYGLLSEVMIREYNNSTSYTTINVLTLFDTLCRLNYSKTIDLGYQLFDKNYNHKSMDYLIPLLLESTEEKGITGFRVRDHYFLYF